MIKVLFVCVHNSARSQIAETLMNDLGKGLFVAESAGLEPGTLNADVVDSMAELGYDMSNNPTKSVFDFYKEGRRYHYVFKVCDQLSGQKCPIFPAAKAQLNWNHEDPSTFEGTKEERLNQVRVVREDIRKNIMSFIEYHQIQEFQFSVHQRATDKQVYERLDINHLTVKDNEKIYVGASTVFFKEKERIQHGQSIVAATNLILFDYAKSIKDTYSTEYLTPTQVRGLMDELWDILYPVKQGNISMQAFVNGLEFFESVKHMNFSLNYRTIDAATSSSYKDSIIGFLTQALSKNRPVAFVNQTSNIWSWLTIFEIDDRNETFSALDNGNITVFNLTDWLNQEETIGGFVYL